MNNRLADHTSVQFFRYETIHSPLYLNYVGFESLAIAIVGIIGLRLKLYFDYYMDHIIWCLENSIRKHSDDDKRHIQTKGQVRALRNSWNGAKVNQQTLGVIKSELAGYSTL